MIKKIIKSCAFFLIFMVMFRVVGKAFIVMDNVDTVNIDGFLHERKDSVDVVLMGQSEIYRGFAPGLAWKEYGIKSVDFSVGDSPCSQYISMLREVLKRQNPKLLVVNASTFLHGDENLDDEVLLRKWIDNMPEGTDKINTINTTMADTIRDNTIVSMGKYHGNWKYPDKVLTSFCLRAHLFFNKGGYLKGFYTRSQTTGGRDKLAEIGWPAQEEYILTERCEKYLRNFLQYCRENKVNNMLMIVPPHETMATKTDGIEKMKAIVDEYGYDFEDYHDNYEKCGIDDTTDFGDYEHLNSYGAEKFTSYLGKYMIDNYDVKTDTSNKDIEYWDECASKTDEVIELSKKSTASGINHGYGEASITFAAKLYHLIKLTIE